MQYGQLSQRQLGFLLDMLRIIKHRILSDINTEPIGLLDHRSAGSVNLSLYVFFSATVKHLYTLVRYPIVWQLE